MKPKAKLGKIEVKHGNITVTIYKRTRTKGDAQYVSFEVAGWIDGQRKLFSFAKEADARAKAEDIATNLAAGNVAALRLTSDDVASYLRAKEVLSPYGVAVELAAVAYADAFRKLNGRSLSDAVNFFLQHHPADAPKRTVAEVCKEMVGAKKDEGKSLRYIGDLDSRLGRFAKDFSMPMSSVTGAHIRTWLQAMNIGNRTRNNFRIAIQALVSFAKARKYLPKNWDEMEAVPVWKEPVGKIHIFTPDQISTLLSVAPENMVPFLAIGAFSGLRSAEIQRLDWSEVDLTKGHIVVAADKAKTAQRRLVPIPANLAAWLKPHVKKRGPVVEISNVPNAIQRLVELTRPPGVDENGKRFEPAVEWQQNALRHSFISYRVAETQNVAAVALEAGNSPKMIFENYRELVTVADAKAWFAVSPQRPENVTEFEPSSRHSDSEPRRAVGQS